LQTGRPSSPGTAAGSSTGPLRYVAVSTDSPNETDLVAISTRDGSVGPALRLDGDWGLPYTPAGAEGISRDGKTLVLGSVQVGLASPSRFLVVNPWRMKVVRTITLPGYFSYDALSPNASRMYPLGRTTRRRWPAMP
jgi:hypothetical protein